MSFVIDGCRTISSYELCIVSVGVVSDLCAAVGKEIQPYCDDIISALTYCLQDATANRDIKPVVFSCVGEIAMAIGAQFAPYVPTLTRFLLQASQAQAHPDDPVMSDFINRLRFSILDSYSGIILGLSDGNALNSLMPYMSNVFYILQFLTTPQSLRDDLCLEKAVALIGDIAQQMGSDPNIKMELSKPYVAQLIHDAGTCGIATAIELATWTQGVVREVLSTP
jgi:importin subunit beta-1